MRRDQAKMIPSLNTNLLITSAVSEAQFRFSVSPELRFGLQMYYSVISLVSLFHSIYNRILPDYLNN